MVYFLQRISYISLFHFYEFDENTRNINSQQERITLSQSAYCYGFLLFSHFLQILCLLSSESSRTSNAANLFPRLPTTHWQCWGKRAPAHTHDPSLSIIIATENYRVLFENRPALYFCIIIYLLLPMKCIFLDSVSKIPTV